jgi:hypothetical protein
LTVTPSGHWVDYPVTPYSLKAAWSRMVFIQALDRISSDTVPVEDRLVAGVSFGRRRLMVTPSGRWVDYPVTPYPLKTDWSRGCIRALD